MDHQSCRQDVIDQVVVDLGSHPCQKVLALHWYRIYHYRQGCAIGVGDGLLVLEDCFALGKYTHGGKGGRWEDVSLGIENMDLVAFQEIQHRLPNLPGSTPQRESCAISQHEAGIIAVNEIDAVGE